MLFDKLYFPAEYIEMSTDAKAGRDGAFPVQIQNCIHEFYKSFILDSLDHASSPAQILGRVVRVPDERYDFVIKISVVLLYLLDVIKYCVNQGLVV